MPSNTRVEVVSIYFKGPLLLAEADFGEPEKYVLTRTLTARRWQS